MKVVLINPWLRKKLFSEEEKRLSESSVLLINETEYFPFEFCYIASKLKKAFEVVVIDANALKMDLNLVMKEVSSQNPDYIGIPTTSYWSARCPTPFIPHVKEIAKEIKRRFPKIKVIVWGTHGTIFPEKILRETRADFVLRGEPELKFPEFILSKNKQKLKGIAYLKKGVLIDNGISEPVALKQLSEADFSVIDFTHYLSKNFTFLVLTTRGCPFNCTYCANSLYSTYRERPIEFVVNEIIELSKQGVKKIAFSDDIFTLNKKRTITLCKALSKIKNMPEWYCQTRADCLDREIFNALKKANCKLVMIGVESVDKKVLNKVNKKVGKEQYERIIEISKEIELPIHLFIISFLPGETKDSLNEIESFLRNNQPVNFSIAVATPLPGSKLWQEMIKKGELKEGYYKECLQNVGCFAKENFSKQFIENYYKIFPTKLIFKMGPKYFLRKIKDGIQNPTQLKHFFDKFYKLVAYKLRKIF